jgi:hypothetical protein
MSDHVVTLSSQYQRDKAHKLIDRAPPGYVVRIAEPRRSGAQNDRLWAMLTEISMAKPDGRRMTPDDWKTVFMHACGWECQFLEGLDGRPFPQGFRSSRLTKSQMTTLLDFIEAFGADYGIIFNDGENTACK